MLHHRAEWDYQHRAALRQNSSPGQDFFLLWGDVVVVIVIEEVEVIVLPLATTTTTTTTTPPLYPQIQSCEAFVYIPCDVTKMLCTLCVVVIVVVPLAYYSDSEYTILPHRLPTNAISIDVDMWCRWFTQVGAHATHCVVILRRQWMVSPRQTALAVWWVDRYNYYDYYYYYPFEVLWEVSNKFHHPGQKHRSAPPLLTVYPWIISSYHHPPPCCISYGTFNNGYWWTQ